MARKPPVSYAAMELTAPPGAPHKIQYRQLEQGRGLRFQSLPCRRYRRGPRAGR
jgi:hypothetical protein